jgi:hypothetical protein
VASAQRWHTAFCVVIIVHYLGVAVSVINPLDGDWTYFRKMMLFSRPIVFLWFLIYAGGQVLVWYWFVNGRGTQQAAQPRRGSRPLKGRGGSAAESLGVFRFAAVSETPICLITGGSSLEEKVFIGLTWTRMSVLKACWPDNNRARAVHHLRNG